MDFDKYLKYSNNDNPVCPFCDSIISIEENELYELYSEETHHVNCPECGKEVVVEVIVTYKFSTENQDT